MMNIVKIFMKKIVILDFHINIMIKKIKKIKIIILIKI